MQLKIGKMYENARCVLSAYTEIKGQVNSLKTTTAPDPAIATD